MLDGFSRSLSQQLALHYSRFAEAIVANLHIDVKLTVNTNLGQVIGVQINHYYAESPEVLCAVYEPVTVTQLCQWTHLLRQDVLDALHDLREFLDPALDSQQRLYHESVSENRPSGCPARTVGPGRLRTS